MTVFTLFGLALFGCTKSNKQQEMFGLILGHCCCEWALPVSSSVSEISTKSLIWRWHQRSSSISDESMSSDWLTFNFSNLQTDSCSGLKPPWSDSEWWACRLSHCLASWAFVMEWEMSNQTLVTSSRPLSRLGTAPGNCSDWGHDAFNMCGIWRGHNMPIFRSLFMLDSSKSALHKSSYQKQNIQIFRKTQL